MSLLGLDMGTSACKAAVFDECGNLLAVASREYAADVPQPGWMEMDPSRMWNAVIEAIREVSAKATDPVQALSVSSQGETFIPVDANGIAVGPAIMNADNRAVEQVRTFERELGKEGVYSIAGCVLHPMYALLKIMWLKEHQPDIYNNADKFLSVGDYILACLGVTPYTDHSLASRTMAFNVTRRVWSQQLLSIAGISENQLPEVRQSGTVAGKLSALTANKLGLPEGTIVAVGGHDQPCGALGAGVIESGDTADSAGSYECLTVASDNPILNQDSLASSFNSYCHVVPDKYVTLAFFPAGVVMRWFRDEFAFPEIEEAKRTGEDVYNILTNHISPGPSGILFTPHFIGSGNPSWDVNAAGAVVGMRPDRTRYDLFKSIMEGIACELSINVEILEKLVGRIDMLRTTGGGAKSSFWLQMRADIIGKKVVSMCSPEAVCLGAAILAGVGAGVYANPEDGARKAVRFNKTYEPDSLRSSEYAAQLSRYKKLYPSLAQAGVY
ncbi:hypothetical protein LLG39_13520 [bacterium]|nr:hypothetical protein [bacterium]